MQKIVKTYLSLFSLLFVAVLLTGCPYQSSVPIDEANHKINKMLLGKWVKTKEMTSDNPEFFVIEKHSKTQYKILKNSYNSSDSTYKEEMYLAHLSKIDDLLFLNMQKDGSGDYYLYKLLLHKEDFTMFEITDNIDEKFNSSKELQAFIKKNMHLSFFYNKDEEKYTKQDK